MRKQMEESIEKKQDQKGDGAVSDRILGRMTRNLRTGCSEESWTKQTPRNKDESNREVLRTVKHLSKNGMMIVDCVLVKAHRSAECAWVEPDEVEKQK